jgi:hypothetical protein
MAQSLWASDKGVKSWQESAVEPNAHLTSQKAERSEEGATF